MLNQWNFTWNIHDVNPSYKMFHVRRAVFPRQLLFDSLLKHSLLFFLLHPLGLSFFARRKIATFWETRETPSSHVIVYGLTNHWSTTTAILRPKVSTARTRPNWKFQTHTIMAVGQADGSSGYLCQGSLSAVCALFVLLLEMQAYVRTSLSLSYSQFSPVPIFRPITTVYNGVWLQPDNYSC